MTERLFVMAEAERQIRVAKRLHAATKPDTAWERLGVSAKRVFIDRACQGEDADLME